MLEFCTDYENVTYLFAGLEFAAVSVAECPCTESDNTGCDLLECSSCMALNALCEADQALPDGTLFWEVNQCPGTYDVFKCIRTGSLLITVTLIYFV